VLCQTSALLKAELLGMSIPRRPGRNSFRCPFGGVQDESRDSRSPPGTISFAAGASSRKRHERRQGRNQNPDVFMLDGITTKMASDFRGDPAGAAERCLIRAEHLVPGSLPHSTWVRPFRRSTVCCHGKCPAHNSWASAGSNGDPTAWNFTELEA